MTIKSKEEMLLYVEADAEQESGIRFYLVSSLHQFYMGDESVKLCNVIVEYEHPNSLNEEQIRTAAIQTLKEKQERIIASAQLKKVELQKKIDKLLLITYQPAGVPKVVNIDDNKMSPNMCKPDIVDFEVPF